MKKWKAQKKIRTADHKRMKDMAALLANPNKQKRDGLLWFFYFFLYTFFISMLALIACYVSFKFEFKHLDKAVSTFGLSK